MRWDHDLISITSSERNEIYIRSLDQQNAHIYLINFQYLARIND
jgi:hypothetical protein